MRVTPTNRWWWSIAAAALALAGGGVAAALLTDVSHPLGPVAAGALGALAAVVVGFLRARQQDTPERQPRHAAPPCGCADSTRRRLLGAGGLAAVAAGVAVVVPLWRATERAERRLRATAWQRGVRLVDDRGSPVRADALEPGAFTTVWPEGRGDAGDSQAVLIRLPVGRTLSGPGRTEWLADDHVAYSKLCTHMGCPVGLYQTDADLLVCPCHQATFDVLRGATPIHGPAERPLPQLPLAVDGDGYLIAADDFSEPVGPGYWSRPS